jgi:hypothetical protein
MLRIKTNKIRAIRGIRGKKKKNHCLADEGSNASRFSFIEIKKSPRIIRMSRIITNKIRKISAIRGKKTSHCPADEGSNALWE